MNIFKYEVKKKFVSTIIWMVSLSLFTFLCFTFFEMMANDAMSEMMEQFPEEFLKAFGLTLDISSVLGYFSFIGTYIILCSAIFAANLGLNSVSIEERDMTADFLISKPVTRNKILTAKILASFVHIFVFSAVNTLVAYLSIEMFREAQEYSVTAFILIMLGIFILEILFFSIGLFISLCLKKMDSPMPFSMGLSFGLFILNTFDTILEDTGIKYLIPFDYFEFGYIIENEALKTYGVIVSCVLVVLLIAGSYVLYNRRNISTAM